MFDIDTFLELTFDTAGLRELRDKTSARFAAAARAAVQDAARDLELDYEKATAAAGLKKLARAWNSKELRLSGSEIENGDLAVSIVYPKGGARTKGAIRAFVRGASIRKGSGMLWWPTGYNRSAGRRNAQPRVTIAKMLGMKDAFVINVKGHRGMKLWCLPVHEAQKRGSNMRVKRMAYAGDGLQVGTSRRRGGARSDSLLKQGFVPMFIGMNEVNLNQRIKLSGLASNGVGRLRANFIDRVAAIT